ncbi:hypothetical protein TNCV_2093761 [Trichonephila clavipes]|nr:hypothetical protein TNCV_2093761 [Trichonephila clavipes]
MNRQIRGSSEGFRSSNPNENNRFNNPHRQENGGKTEIMRDTSIIANHKESLIGSKAKVSQIIGDSRVDAKVDNRISDSTIRAVDKVGQEIVHFGVKMNEIDI